MSTSWECIAFDGERVPHGENYVPGPDNCTACKCEKGKPRFCRAALCQPPQDCRSFRIGESCCDFLCLDNILPTLNNDLGGVGPSSDAGLRLVASAITAILSLALLLFLIHRLRQRKLRTAQHQYFEDQLDALGGLPSDSCRNNPCCHSAIYLSGNDQVDFFLDGHTPPFSPWKPPSYYFQHGDAPPPYSEVVAGDRARAEGPLPSLNPLMVQLPTPREPVYLDSQRSNKASFQQRDSLLVSEAVSALSARRERQAREERSISLQTNPFLNLAILSDEVYNNSSPFTENADRVRPHSLHNPPFSSLNDLNRGTIQSNSSTNVCGPAKRDASLALEEPLCQCVSSNNFEKCNVCSGAGQQAAAKNKKHVPRSRQKACSTIPSSTGKTETESERASAVEDFRLRLRLDISSSSTSASTELTSRPLSIGSSSSSRSSEDAPSIESSAEATC